MDKFEKSQDANVVLKRGEGIRLMTVHGAKGLQAPIVILADAGNSNSSQLDKIVYGPNFFCLRLPTTTLFELKELERKASNAERHRLFYVAITRAQDFLIATGIEKSKLPSWYDFIEQHRTTTEILPFSKTIAALASNPENEEEVSESLLMPHKSITTTNDHSQSTKASRKGEQLHKVIEVFPNLMPEQQSLSFIKSLDLDMIEQSDLDHVETLINDSLYNELIQGENYRELNLVFHEKGRAYQLRLDHVIFNEKQITIIDYKTGQTVPSSFDEIPQEYQKQMDLYQRALKKMYPKKKIRSFLIYVHPHCFFEFYNDFDGSLGVTHPEKLKKRQNIINH
jgi:ATP-dependent helicase/nuclease subunit A